MNNKKTIHERFLRLLMNCLVMIDFKSDNLKILLQCHTFPLILQIYHLPVYRKP